MTLVGSQVPTFEWRPDRVSSAGQDAVDLAGAAGLIMDRWQASVLDGSLGEDRAGRWVCNEVGLIVGRQSGKGGVIEARELAGVFTFGETLILHSAHQQRTSNDAFTRMKAIIESYPDFDRRVTKVAHSKGEEGFTFRFPGEGQDSWTREAKLRYMARSGSAGRGFTKANTIILDEAMILDHGPIAAVVPTMATQPNWQVWYTASQGDRRLPTESRVLAQIRNRGYRREPGLYFAEWSAHLRHTRHCPVGPDGRPTDPLDVRADPRTWAKTNPAMGIRISEEFLRKMIVGGAMATWDADREFLGVGDLPDVEGWNLFPETVWDSLSDAGSRRGTAFAVGIAVAVDQGSASVAVASRRPDGMWHWEWLTTRPGVAWLGPYLRELDQRRPVVYVVDGKSPTLADVRDAVGTRKVYTPTTVDYPAWCSRMVSLVAETGEARHIGQPTLDAAARVVERKIYPDGSFVWRRTDTAGDISPWEALTLAVGGVLVRGSGRRNQPLVAAV